MNMLELISQLTQHRYYCTKSERKRTKQHKIIAEETNRGNGNKKQTCKHLQRSEHNIEETEDSDPLTVGSWREDWCRGIIVTDSTICT